MSAREIEDLWHVQRLTELVGGVRLRERVLPPCKSRAQQTQRFASAGRTLQKGILTLWIEEAEEK